MSDSVWPHGQQPTRLFCPQNSLGKNIGVGCHFLLHHIMIADTYSTLPGAVLSRARIRTQGVWLHAGLLFVTIWWAISTSPIVRGPICLHLTLVWKWSHKLDQEASSPLLTCGPWVTHSAHRWAEIHNFRKNVTDLTHCKGIRSIVWRVRGEPSTAMSWEMDGIIEEGSWEGCGLRRWEFQLSLS